MKIAYLGPGGTFSHQAAHHWADKQSQNLMAYPTVMATLLAVLDNKADAAVVPVENSIEGSVNITLDFLAEKHLGTAAGAIKLKILGEVVLDIVHCLVAVDQETFPQVIVSHPQALAQCRGYLKSNYPDARFEQAESTAHAAATVARQGKGWAAVSSTRAAVVNNLVIRQRGIADSALNQTRFLLVGTQDNPPSGEDKTSLLMALPQDKPGGLYSILHEFARSNINLTRIESRPSKKELGEYIFYIDCEGHAATPPLADVLSALKEKTLLLAVLGSYPVYVKGSDNYD